MTEGNEARKKTLWAHEKLLDHYGEPKQKEQREPLEELVVTILSQNTSDVNSGRAYRSLRERFDTWEEILEAPTEEVADAIRTGGLANVKAPRIQRILRQLQENRDSLDMDFLKPMPVDEAREYLTSLYGVGPKTAACVLLFSLHKPAMPVDTHVHRVSLRVGLIAEGTSAEKAHRLLEDLLPEDLYYPFHLNMIRHGRTLCTSQSPECYHCPLASRCDYAEEHPERLEEPTDED